MNNLEAQKYLRIPLYFVNYVEDLSKFSGLGKEKIERFKIEYSDLERKQILNAIKWALENPTFDFRGLLPGIKYENQQITEYFKIILPQLESG